MGRVRSRQGNERLQDTQQEHEQQQQQRKYEVSDDFKPREKYLKQPPP